MDVIVVTPHRYGIHEVATRVGEEWSSFGHNVDYITPEGSAARIGSFTVGVPGIALWWYRTLKQLIESDYDLIWTHQPVTPRLPTKDPSFWRRVLITFHTTEHAEYRLARKGVYPRRLLPYLWCTKSLEARFYRRLTALNVDWPTFTVVAPHLADEVEALGVEEAIHVPNGVFTADSGEYRPIRAEYGIPDDATLVFNVGSHTAQKRPVQFAETMRGVVDSNDGIYCVMAGNGPLHDSVAAVANGQLIARGYVSNEEKWRWFNDAEVFASLSAYEGMPMAIMEALSFGLPVVLSDVPAHRGLVEAYDIKARLVDIDPSNVGSAISELAGSVNDLALPEWPTIAEEYIEASTSE